jgi:tetratricopeptide (TPR) repeat protein
MNDVPRGEPSVPGAAAGAPVALERTDGSPEPLGTRDLTFREIRDSLWMATRLRPPVDQHVKPPEPPVEAPRESEATRTERDRPAESATPRTRGGTAGDDWVPTSLAAKHHGMTGGAHGWRARSWPTVPALSDARQLARALRPLMHRYASPWHRVVDEEATAERAAQDGLWIPEWRSGSWRRFDVVLVVDTSRSMEIWHRTAREFRAMLAQLGAFRDIRTYLIDTSPARLAARPLRAEGSAGRTLHCDQLVDPTGRRILLLMTDTIGEAWHSGAIGRVLFQWGQKMPVAVVQTLAQRLWSWGGLPVRRMSLSAPFPGAANRELRVLRHGNAPDLADPQPALPVPVLGLSPDWMAAWARLLTTPGASWVESTGTLVCPRAPAPPARTDEPMTADKCVHRFRTIASVRAFRLAALLAAAPLNLPLMQLVQRVLLPSSGLSELAEVMLGGLLRRTSVEERGRDAVSYEFVDGVREELLACASRADTAMVARVLDEYAGDEIAALRNFGAALGAPDETSEPETSPENLPYVRVQAAVFRALSGPYQRRAKRLHRRLELADVNESGMRPLSPDPAPAEGTSHGRSTVSTTKTARDTSQSGTGQGEGLTPSNTVHLNPVSSPQIWGEVPLRNPDFVGRDDLLAELRLRLLEPGGKAAVLPEALFGLGGVGKSQTVVEYIYRHAAEYDVVWWVSAEQPPLIKSSFIDLAKRLNVAAADSADTAVPAVLEALRRGEPYARWILVFDNADRPDDVRHFFPAGAGHVVVTSRNSDWGGFARSVEVNLFTREESVELLRRRGGDLTDDDADRLAEALGDLPLAIEQAASWRAQTGMPVAEYLELLEQNRTELLGAGTASDYHLPVAAAWNVPLSKLRRDHKAALQLLQLCAFFGPEPISRRLFTGVRDAPVPPELWEALRDPIMLNQAIREISRYSLAKIDHRNSSLQLHRLVQAVLKNQLPDDAKDKMRHAVHYMLAHADPADPDLSDNWRRYAELLPHVVMSRAVECEDPLVRALLQGLVTYLLNIGDFGGARDLAYQARESWSRENGDQELDTLVMTRLYAVALRRLGEVEEARRLNRQTLDTMRQNLGDDHEVVLRTMDIVAADRRAEGAFAEELKMQQQVYDRAKQVLGVDDPHTLIYANNLGSCLRLMGDFRGALALDEDTLRRRTMVLGSDHLMTIGSCNALAMDMREAGRYYAATALQQQTLVRQREVVGTDHPSTLGAIRNLAVALRKSGRHREACECAEECLELYQLRRGDRHLDTASARMTLSVDRRILGDLDESLSLASDAYQVFQATMGELHPFSMIAATNLAVTHRLRGNLDQARKLDEAAYRQLRTAFDRDHPFTLVSATNLASDLAAMGEFAEARRMDADTVERSSRVLEPEHPYTLAVALNLAIDLAGLGERAESDLLHSRTVANLRHELGPEHPATAAAGQLVRANCDIDTMQL